MPFPAIVENNSLRQLLRYGIVGIAQNGVFYLVYLIFTALGFDPKTVAAISYPCAMLASFLGNRRYTFNFRGGLAGSGGRFIAAHACAYAINLGLLHVFAYKLGYAHQLVQAAAIFVCAAFLFLALKLFVFPARPAARPLS